MPPSALSLELCALEKVAVGIEQRDVVGRPDRAMAEQGFVPEPSRFDRRFVERLDDRMLVRVVQWPAPRLLDEHLSYIRVELRTGAAGDLAAAGLGREGRAIRTSLDHRAEGRRHRHDARRERDVRACKLRRVTAAVPSLLVVADGG